MIVRWQHINIIRQAGCTSSPNSQIVHLFFIFIVLFCRAVWPTLFAYRAPIKFTSRDVGINSLPAIHNNTSLIAKHEYNPFQSVFSAD